MEQSEDRTARWGVLAAMALTLAVMLPALLVSTVFGGDDWAWVWVYRDEGPALVQQHLSEAAHPGYGPILNLFFLLGGDIPARLARGVAFTFHLANGWLVWRIFRDGQTGPAFSSTVAVLYLMAPFLAGLNHSLAHTMYDVFIFFYLLSIWLSGSTNALMLAGAIVAALIGLSIETLAALEPLRWWYLWQRRGAVRTTVLAAVPFILVILALAAVRAIWLVPEGVFAGYNSIKALSAADFEYLAMASLRYLTNFDPALDLAVKLVRFDSMALVALLALASAAVGLSAWRAGKRASIGQLGMLALLGAVVVIVGTAPYIAIGRIPDRGDFSMRFAVVSQFGALILAATAIELAGSRTIKGVVLAAAVFVFSAQQLEFAKWMLHEELVLRDYGRQVERYLASTGDQVLVVQFKPPSKTFLYRNRGCLSSYDNNVGLELAGERHGSFVYDRDCGPMHYADPNGCRFAGFRAQPCPPVRRSAEFALKPGMEHFEAFRLAELARRAIVGPPIEFGTFIPDHAAGSGAAVSETR